MKHNWVAIIVVVVIAQVLGFLWYGVLFQEPWAAGFGIDMATVDASDPVPYVVSVTSSLLAAIGLSWLIQGLGVKDGMGGVKLALIVWVCFVGVTLWTHYAFGQIGASATWVDMANGALTLAIAGFILASWQKTPA